MHPDFWLDRWRANRIGVQRDTPLPLLVRHWPGLGLPAGSRVCVPLCGKSLDMVWLAEQGHRVLGIELATLAIEQFFDERGLSPHVRPGPGGIHYRAGPWELVAGDAFAIPADLLADCAGVYDRGALIALPSDMRATYARTTWRRLPAGCRGLLVTLEYPPHEKQGPPFPVDEDEVRVRFGSEWEVALLERRDILAGEPSFQAEGVTALSTAAYRLQRTPGNPPPR